MNILSTLKTEEQDFEFYPTTGEIIGKLIQDIKYSRDYRHEYSSILDIGAGNGKVLSEIKRAFENIETYAIEKSQILRNSLDQSIYIIGTDFLEQSLIDKNIDLTFCNPPYSEYEQWAKKIIRESTSSLVYLVIPTRFKESIEIKQALEYREAEYKIIGEFSFEKAEDRQARALVNLIRIKLSIENDDAFNRLFEEEFKSLNDKFTVNKDGEEEEKKEESKFTHLVTGKNYVENLVKMYVNDMAIIKKNYDLVGQLDADLLREFNIKPATVRKLLKERLKGLKNLYWNELISRMDEITSRLISKKRDNLFRKLHENGNVDFTESNIYSVILWILKNANMVIDEQLIEIYEQMISKANVKNYKSNTRVFKYDRWRYNDEKPSHIYLEYRLVLEYCGRIEHEYSKYRLSNTACDYIRDLLTIANNLNFSCRSSDNRLYHYDTEKYWLPGKPVVFHCEYKGKEEVLMEVKAHLNGNIHIRMNQKFALALNVEYGRLKGWLHSKEQAAEEIQEKAATEYFKSNCKLLSSSVLLLN